MEWERGNLLRRCRLAPAGAWAEYGYTNQGVRYRRRVGSVETRYRYDGGKLVSEERVDGTGRIVYLYDAEGMCGIVCDSVGRPYTFLKDGGGSVVGLLSNGGILVARYEYDAWGVCRVLDGEGRDLTDFGHIGHVNPIRFKSMYFDVVTGMYLADGSGGGGSRWYSPLIRQYVSACEPGGALGSAGVIYGLNPYLLCLTNPVGLVYDGYSVLPNADLVFDPPVMTWWQKFFDSPLGRVFAVVVAVVAKLLLPGVGFAISAALIGVAFSVRAGIAGYRSWARGGGVWSGVAGFVVDNWAMSVGLGFGLALMSFGVKKAVVAVKNAGAKVPPPSAPQTPNLSDGLGTYATQKGHHPMAKIAFEGLPNYNADLAITISANKLKSFGVEHVAITGKQTSLYTKFAKGGQKLTMSDMKQIEINAMVEAGMPLDFATHAVNEAIGQLNSWGIFSPFKTPWG